MRDNPPKNKILVVGRRGVGKLSLVHAILGSRFIPTTSASRSRPASPLLLPATTIPSLEEAQSFDGPSHHIRQGTTAVGDDVAKESTLTTTTTTTSTTEMSKDPLGTGASEATGARPRVDHSGVTIPWTIDTKYYTVKVDFWIDETDPKGRHELERMIESGDLDEIGAVVEAVVFCFSRNDPSTFHDIKPWITFIERMEPAITLCVATDAPMQPKSDDAGAVSSPPASPQQEDDDTEDEEISDYDDWCLSNGFEYVNLHEDTEGLGADEHVGLDRILEALAAHMWDGLKRKSNKKQGQHTRNMIRSFSVDPDGNDVSASSSMMLDMSAILGSQSQSHISREYLEKLSSMTQQVYDHEGRISGGQSLDHIREEGRYDLDEEDDINKIEEGDDDDDDDDDDEEDDEDDDRAFYRALAELSLQNRALSPSGPSTFQREHRSYDADVDEDTTGEDPWSLQHSGDLDSDTSSHAQATTAMTAAAGAGVVSGTHTAAVAGKKGLPKPTNNRNSVTMQDLMAEDQERQAQYFLSKPFVQAAREDEENSEEEGGVEMARGNGNGEQGLESEFSLRADDHFEFGDYVAATGNGDTAGFEDDFMNDPTFGGKWQQYITSISREMIEDMHQTLFGNMDDEDGMARTLETLRGLREEGKTMSDKDRRELAARVALSFGMQMDR
ncbi:hypothetical protein BGZ73_000725 [Actinomortierella ambigua]|nr:hypothetical protein BGZ73_000725 [Actinomortierella ambigua]